MFSDDAERQGAYDFLQSLHILVRSVSCRDEGCPVVPEKIAVATVALKMRPS